MCNCIIILTTMCICTLYIYMNVQKNTPEGIEEVTMSLTVFDMMQLPPINLGTLVAGENGLDNNIELITVIEYPESSEFLEQHLCAISSMTAIAYDIDKQLSLIKLLKNNNASAMILFNVGVVMPSISPQLIELCNELDFPLINMPLHISYYDVVKAVIDKLLSYQVQKLQESVNIYETYMTQLLKHDNNYSSLLDILSKTIQHTVLFFNHNQKCVYSSNKLINNDISAYFTYHLQKLVELSGYQANNTFVQIEGVSYLLVPVTDQRYYYGTVVIKDMQQPISDASQLAISQTCKALCITVYNRELRDEHNKRIIDEYVYSLLFDKPEDIEFTYTQDHGFGFDANSISGIMVITPYKYKSRKTKGDKDFSILLESIYHQAELCIEDDKIIFLAEHGQIVILSTHKDSVKKYLPSIADRIIASFKDSDELPSIGIGPDCPSAQMISQCYKKACNIIEISEKLFNKPQCSKYEDLAVYELLYSSIDRNTAYEITNRTLEPIKKFDKTYNSQLEETLFALLTNNVSSAEIAEKMFLHKNTILQRKNKILSLCGPDSLTTIDHVKYELCLILQKLFDL